MDTENCVICKTPIEKGQETVKLALKGAQGINRASEDRGDDIVCSSGAVVHQICRKQYCHPTSIQREKRKRENSSESTSRSLRSQRDSFSFDKNCLFCGLPATGKSKPKGCDVFTVRTLDFQKTVENTCTERSDCWADEGRGRLKAINDLPAADAIYHQTCSVNFRTNKNVSSNLNRDNEPPSAKKQQCGRPEMDEQSSAFLQVARYFKENDDEQITVSALVDKMRELCGELAYTPSHMKRKLRKHLCLDIIFSEINGKANVVTFRSTASSILQNFYERPKSHDTDAEKKQVITTAAKLICSDIKSMSTTKQTYHLSDDISSVEKNLAFTPESLQLFLTTIFSQKDPKIKVASIGQSIVQAARPKVLIAPLQIGLGVQMHHHFASRFLVDSLHALGFCSSYTEVLRFETSAAASSSSDESILPAGRFIQFAADNVDHDIGTIDGRNTFHGMGIIAGITPAVSANKLIHRVSITPNEISSLAKIDIHFYKQNGRQIPPLILDAMRDIVVEDNTRKLDILTQIPYPLKPANPGWMGVMQTIQSGTYPGKSSTMFLPMIDMNPSNMSCIYSTLVFVADEAKKVNMVPIITFDQPLYWKAQMIVQAENKDTCSALQSVVLRLGGFHVEMSFLGCIGHLMSGSGLQELLETIYASNTVVHMMTGKAVSRAVRGHFLVDNVLNTILMASAFSIDLQQLPTGKDDYHC